MPLLLGTDPSSIERAARIVRAGGLVAFPTDTVYGLGTDPFSDAAVERLFEAKGRESKPVPVLCADQESAASLVALAPEGLRLAKLYWPGALTIVAPLKRSVPAKLDQGSGLLGVRVPDSSTARALASDAGGFLTGTSANISGRPSCRTSAEVLDSIGERLDAVIDGGRLDAKESTVIKVVGGVVEVLRRGEIAFEPGIARER